MKLGTLSLVTTLLLSTNLAFAAEASYYDQLKSLVSRSKLKVYPKDLKADINRVSFTKGGAGLDFGSTIDDLVKLWGKPSGIMIDEAMDEWSLGIGACRFDYIDNQLVTISVHSATIPDAQIENGITFKSSYEEIKSAFPNIDESRTNKLRLRTEDGYIAEFRFVPDYKMNNELKLITVSVHHPDSGR